MNPLPTKGSNNFNTIAAVLGVSEEISGELITVSLPVYTKNDHKYPVVDSHSSKVLMPNFEDFNGRYCRNDNRPFYKVKFLSIAMFCFGKYND